MYTDYLLLTASIICAALNNIFLHLYNDKKNYTCNIFAFNAIVSLIWTLIFIIVGGGFGHASLTTIVYGLIYGVIIALFLMFKMASLGSGPVSITSLIGCCSLIVPTLFGLIFYEETVNYLQIIGLVVLFVALYLCVDPKSNMKISKKWIIFCVIFFLCAGASGVLLKMYNKSGFSAEMNTMMIITALTAMVSFVIIYVVGGLLRKRQNKPFLSMEKNKKSLLWSVLFMFLCGLVSGGYQRLNMYLTGALPSILFFPTFNGVVIFLSCASGVVLFKEKLSVKQIIGLILGVVCIMLVGNVFSFLV